MCAPWLGNMPGWLERGFWQYENKALDELGKKLFRGDFKSRAERDELYREMTRICLDESVRVWVATVMTSTPLNFRIRGVTEDLGAGVRSLWFLREAYIEGKNELTVGHLWVWTPRTVWNPVAGFNDVYSVDIWRNIVDPPLARHPFTGVPMPFRARYEVETAGPDGTLTVPEDAVIWNAEKDTWERVKPGTTAVSKVTFDYSLYTKSKWHHGIEISMADILYSISQIFELAYDSKKSNIEVAISATSKPILETFKGFRIVDENTLEVYVDYWHFDENYIAEYASIWGASMPWEILAAMDEEIFNKPRGLFTYSDTAAARLARQQISLILRDHVSVLRRTLLEFIREEKFPEGVFTVLGKKYESLENALRRYEAALEWLKEKGHLVISNGPFYLEIFDPAAQYAELRAFRDSSYPFKPGDWYMGRIERPEIVSVEKELSPADDAIEVRVRGRGEMKIAYILKNPATGEILEKGTSNVAGDRAEIKLKKPPSPGIYSLDLLLYSDEVSIVDERIEFIEVLTVEKEETTPTITTMTTTPTAVETTEEPTPMEEPQQQPPLTMIVIAIVAIAVIAAALTFMRRRRG